VSRQARILLLCDDRRGHANTVLDHIDAFRRFSRHQVRIFNPKALKRSLALDLDEFDVVVVHYSVVPSDPHFISPHLREKLRRFDGLKVQFIQDDYRWVDKATAASRDIGIDVLFTIAPEPAAGQLYDERLPGVRRVMTLTGYVPDALKDQPVRPLRERTLDVAYRARDLPFWYGRLSREKAWIGQRFVELAPRYGLRCDIAWQEQDRIYGKQWIEFMSSCRATLGTESGASIADFDGRAEQSVRAYLRAHPGAPYEEVDEAVLKPYEGNVIVHVVSPRVFEAASLGTAMVMFPGEYSGVLTASEHYIPLEKDFSNMDEVAARLRDDTSLEAMTRRAYDDLIASGRWSYKAFIEGFDKVIDEEAKTARGAAATPRWVMARAERSVRVPGLRVRLFRGMHSFWKRVFRRDPSMRFDIEYESQIQKALFTMRIVATDSDMRLLLRLGRLQRAPLDRLLREIMELSLLRKAANGGVEPAQAFRLDPVYDPERRSLCFVSTPGGQDRELSPATAHEIRDALRKGELKVIEWDHRALGGTLHLDRPAMEVGIGFEGLESFTVLTAIGRSNPAAVERALGSALRASEAGPVTNSVG
jgi:hypothetical protein